MKMREDQASSKEEDIPKESAKRLVSAPLPPKYSMALSVYYQSIDNCYRMAEAEGSPH